MNLHQYEPSDIDSEVQYADILRDMNLPQLKIDELTTKTKKLIEEHNQLLKKNKQLRRSIKDLEVKKRILTKPQCFPIEMRKILNVIRTYKIALNELEMNAEYTLNKIDGVVNQTF